MVKSIYPSGEMRRNYMARMYCEMAMESYYGASEHHAEIIKMGYSYDSQHELEALEKCVVSTIVFAAMSIEAFINDYAAACLGDDDFYDNFDRLSTLSKFELIARFILHSEVDTGKSYYSYLKALIKLRDSYVHSKSHAVAFEGMSEEDVEAYYNYLQTEEPKEAPLLNKNEINEEMRSARDSLKALKEFADYFDKRDSNAYALHKLFGPSTVHYGPEKERKYKRFVFSMLGIKTSG